VAGAAPPVRSPLYTPTMIKAVIFDCDGTIVDSRHLIVPFYNWLFAEVGLPPIDETDPEAVAICLGLPDDDVFSHFIPDQADRRRVFDRLSQLDPADFVDELRVEPHALDVLRELRDDYRLAIATNRGHDMTAIMRRFGFDAYIETVVTAMDVANPKPSPDMLLLAAERLGVEPAEALYIGDTDVDGLAAEAAGMEFVCYRRVSEVIEGFGCVAVPEPPDGCLSDLRALLTHLEERNGG
jgi:phosphoglycolate phosphatase